MTRALVVRQPGGPDAMHIEDRPLADPGEGQICLRHTAIGLNYVDVYQRAGVYKVATPFVPGNEGAGVVTAIGPGVDTVQPGDRVAYQGQLGAYADERLLKADRAIPIPAGIDDATAAAATLKGLTAYYLLFKTWPVAAGQTILWHAAAGGVGLIACQWAKALGARVIGTLGSDEKMPLALANGCDAVINSSTEDFAARVLDLTGGAGVDVVYDGVGKATFEKSLDCLRPRGLMVSFGNASGVVAVPDLGILASKGSLFLTRPTGTHYYAKREELLEGAGALFEAIGSGNVKISVNHTFPLADAVQAHIELEARRTTGSVILRP